MKEKEEKTEVKKIVLTIEGKEIVISLEGAKKLKKVLNELFTVTYNYNYPSYPLGGVSYPGIQPWYGGVAAGIGYLTDSPLAKLNEIKCTLDNPAMHSNALLDYLK